MKTNIKTLILLLILTVALYSFSTIQSANQQTKDEIIGTWVSQKDINWKMKFTNTNKCYWYYENTKTDDFTYTLNNYSCNNELDSEYEYLKIVKFSKIHCYAVNGITTYNGEIYLSLEYDGKPRPMIFKKE